MAEKNEIPRAFNVTIRARVSGTIEQTFQPAYRNTMYDALEDALDLFKHEMSRQYEGHEIELVTVEPNPEGR